VAREEGEPALDRVARRVEARLVLALEHEPGAVASARWQPPFLAAREVERAEIGPRRERAHDDRADGLAHGVALVEPRQPFRIQGHRRTAVDDDRDARRLV